MHGRLVRTLLDETRAASRDAAQGRPEKTMLTLEIPGHETLRLEHLVLDYNGTLAVDGRVLTGVASRLASLATPLTIHVVTADTFGQAAEQLADLAVDLVILPAGDQALAKGQMVQKLGSGRVAAIGNGRNDESMLAEAVLGIAVIQEECACTRTLLAADITAPSITAALDLLLHPLRLAATCRG